MPFQEEVFGSHSRGIGKTVMTVTFVAVGDASGRLTPMLAANSLAVISIPCWRFFCTTPIRRTRLGLPQATSREDAKPTWRSTLSLLVAVPI